MSHWVDSHFFTNDDKSVIWVFFCTKLALFITFSTVYRFNLHFFVILCLYHSKLHLLILIYFKNEPQAPTMAPTSTCCCLFCSFCSLKYFSPIRIFFNLGVNTLMDREQINHYLKKCLLFIYIFFLTQVTQVRLSYSRSEL